MLSELKCIHYTMEYFEADFIKDKVNLYIVTRKMFLIYCKGRASNCIFVRSTCVVVMVVPLYSYQKSLGCTHEIGEFLWYVKPTLKQLFFNLYIHVFLVILTERPKN